MSLLNEGLASIQSGPTSKNSLAGLCARITILRVTTRSVADQTNNSVFRGRCSFVYCLISELDQKHMNIDQDNGNKSHMRKMVTEEYAFVFL